METGKKNYMDILGIDQGGLPDSFKIELLSRGLDSANKNILSAHKEKGGSYQEFLKILDRRYLVDVQEYNRKKWFALRFPNPQKITREELREFKAQFQQGRDRVGDYTVEEEYNLLMSKLNFHWRQKIIGEEEKLNKEKFWLRVGKIGDFDKNDLAEFLSDKASEWPVDVKEREGHFLVQFKSEEARDRILDLHGRKITGRSLVIADIGQN